VTVFCIKELWKTLHYITSEIQNNILIISLFDEGTTQEGKVDGWYGESGLDSEGKSQKYEVDAVLNSKAGITITGFTTKLQLQAKKHARTSQNGSADKGIFIFIFIHHSINPLWVLTHRI
jgi:hypothetical protein